ncbi:MAG TPA: hypothetical protein VHE37_06045 [Nevskiaceae bacterium]|nr:hypothetical protein [Nevskiaceae bacterium]
MALRLIAGLAALLLTVAQAQNEAYLTRSQVEQCLRAKARAGDNQQMLLNEKARLDAVSLQFQAEAGRLRGRYAQIEARRRQQDHLEAATGGLRTGRSMGDADLAAIDRELSDIERGRAELEQQRADYNHALDDHNARFARHYAQVQELNRRFDAQRSYAQTVDTRCTHALVRESDRRAAQAVVDAENARRPRR